MKIAVFSLFLLGLVSGSLQCSPPGPDWKPLTVEDLARRAPLVIKAYLLNSSSQAPSFPERSKRCFYVAQIYKGSLHPHDSSYICAEKFGDGAQCLSEVYYGSPYIIFLNKLKNGRYEARYDEIHSAVKPFSQGFKQAEQLRKGLCCVGDCDKRLPCRRNSCGVIVCDCGLQGTVKGARPGPPGGK